MSTVRWFLGRLGFLLVVGLAIAVTGALVAQIAYGRLDPSILSTVAGTTGVVLFLAIPWWIGRRIDRRTSDAMTEGSSTRGIIVVVCIISLAGMVVFAPSITRRALSRHADWFLGGERNADVLAWGSQLGALIPRSTDPGPAFPDDDHRSEPGNLPGANHLSDSSRPSDPSQAPGADRLPDADEAPPGAAMPASATIHDHPPADDAPPIASTIFSRGAPAVVVIETQSPIDAAKSLPWGDIYKELGVELEERRGTGFIVEPGIIVTAYHVVKGATRVQVTLHNGRVSRQVVRLAEEPQHDLALIQIDDPIDDILPLALAKIGSVTPGQSSYVIGNPERLDYSINTGIVSGLRTLHGTHLIQTQAPLSFGSSGGPMLDDAGLVIGIVTHAMGQGQNLAVGLEHLTPMLASASSATPQPYDLYEPQPKVDAMDDDANALTSVDKFAIEGIFGLLARVVDRCLERLPSPARLELAVPFDTRALVGNNVRVRGELPASERHCIESSTPMLWHLIGVAMLHANSSQPFTIGLDVVGLRARPHDERPPEHRRMRLDLTFTSPSVGDDP